MKIGNAALVSLLLLAACGGGDSGQTKDAAPEKSLADRVQIDADTRARIGLEFDTVDADSRSRSIRVPGTVILDPSRSATVGSLVEGRVRAIHARLGARVSKGAVLVEIESPALGEMVAECIRAMADERAAGAEAERVTLLHREKVASDRELQNAESAAVSARMRVFAARKRLTGAGMAQADLDALLRAPGEGETLLRLRAPITGVVSAVHANIGKRTDAAADLVSIVDPSVAVVEGGVFLEQIDLVHPGLSVTFETRAYPEQSFQGRVSDVGSVLDPASRALPLRCAFQNNKGLLRPNLPGTLIIATDRLAALSIPSSALVRDGNRAFVFVRSDDSTFLYREVRIAAEHDDRVDLREGIQPGDIVVRRGGFTLKSMLKVAQDEE
ncbi:MAG: efflux RND transporter periplasmic adaptor subunit [Ignavibacteriae bacterium]|nr:efflux RND transporter periplasmic adaptor subunit [Ignavibacteriota bacterium]